MHYNLKYLNIDIKNEYNSDIRMEPISFTVARWVKGKTVEQIKKLTNSRCTFVFDHFDRPILFFAKRICFKYIC